MRQLALLPLLFAVAAAASVSACADSDPTLASHVTLNVGTLQLPDLGEACFAAQVATADGEVLWEIGSSAATPATAAEARAAGAVCGTSFRQASPCVGGASHVATVWTLGFWDTAGEPIPVTNPCAPGGEGCARTFTCVDGDDVTLDYSPVVMRESFQGFLEVEMVLAPPAGDAELCYAVRLVQGDGALVWAKDDICSSMYGNGPAGAASYIGPCDSAANDNVVTVWVHDPPGASDAGWVNPCPSPADGDPSPETWSGGCARPFTCVRNADVLIQFDLAADR